MPRSNVGQVALVSPIPWVTTHGVDITYRTPEAACWLRLGCWSDNFAHSHPSPGAFNRRVLCSCLLPQCPYLPYRPRHQRRLANCDWMPACYTSGQPSNPRRHPTCWASSQWSHTVSSTVFPLSRKKTALSAPFLDASRQKFWKSALAFLDAISFTGENFTTHNLIISSKMYGTYFHDWSRSQDTAYRKFRPILGILHSQGL